MNKKSPIYCPMCKKTVIGYKYPPTLKGFSCDVEHNSKASINTKRFFINGDLNISKVCNDCYHKGGK